MALAKFVHDVNIPGVIARRERPKHNIASLCRPIYRLGAQRKRVKKVHILQNHCCH